MTADERHDGRDDLAALQRWEDAGGTWRVVAGHHDGEQVTISRCQCTGGEEVDRLVSADAELIAYVRRARG